MVRLSENNLVKELLKKRLKRGDRPDIQRLVYALDITPRNALVLVKRLDVDSRLFRCR